MPYPSWQTLSGTTQAVDIPGFSVLAIQNADTNDPDDGTRLYVIPKGDISTGTGGAIKIFGNDYTKNQTDYRDLGIYFSADQHGDTGTNGGGCFYLNSKSNGSYAGNVPDVVFTLQDGAFVAGRFCETIVGGTGYATIVIGPSQPEHANKRHLVLELNGDTGFSGDADHSIYWETTGGVSSNVLTFERTASNGNLRLKLGGSQKALFTGSGDLVLGDNAADLATTSTVGFFHIRSMNGAPTGIPTTYSGAVPLVLDRADGKLYAYYGGSWKSVTFA